MLVPSASSLLLNSTTWILLLNPRRPRKPLRPIVGSKADLQLWRQRLHLSYVRYGAPKRFLRKKLVLKTK